ncbi:MAG: DinB family protein [Vicinamibacterales bacterium]
MKRTIVTMTVAAAILSVGVLAQAPAANPLTGSVRKTWEGAKLNIVESAQQMPEANYGFKPIATVRSFGEILAHTAGSNYVFCSAAKGEKSPHAEGDFEKTATTRAEIMKAVNDSLAYCDGVINSMNDKKLAESVDMPFNMGKATRAEAIIDNVGHLNEHYGNLVTYFRLKGMVPPSSKR